MNWCVINRFNLKHNYQSYVYSFDVIFGGDILYTKFFILKIKTNYQYLKI